MDMAIFPAVNLLPQDQEILWIVTRILKRPSDRPVTPGTTRSLQRG
ncbi:hypothetical protein [Rhodospirillum sp. A1_3_36]